MSRLRLASGIRIAGLRHRKFDYKNDRATRGRGQSTNPGRPGSPAYGRKYRLVSQVRRRAVRLYVVSTDRPCRIIPMVDQGRKGLWQFGGGKEARRETGANEPNASSGVTRRRRLVFARNPRERTQPTASSRSRVRPFSRSRRRPKWRGFRRDRTQSPMRLTTDADAAAPRNTSPKRQRVNPSWALASVGDRRRSIHSLALRARNGACASPNSGSSKRVRLSSNGEGAMANQRSVGDFSARSNPTSAAGSRFLPS